jgi:hypothetical protein
MAMVPLPQSTFALTYAIEVLGIKRPWPTARYRFSVSTPSASAGR